VKRRAWRKAVLAPLLPDHLEWDLQVRDSYLQLLMAPFDRGRGGEQDLVAPAGQGAAEGDERQDVAVRAEHCEEALHGRGCDAGMKKELRRIRQGVGVSRFPMGC